MTDTVTIKADPLPSLASITPDAFVVRCAILDGVRVSYSLVLGPAKPSECQAYIQAQGASLNQSFLLVEDAR